MPAPIKPATKERYWRTVEVLSRLIIALERDDVLDEGVRRAAATAAETLRIALMQCAKGRAA